MKKATFLLTIVFTIVTFLGAGYVLYNGGQVNAGYAIVPMLLTVISMSLYRQAE